MSLALILTLEGEEKKVALFKFKLKFWVSEYNESSQWQVFQTVLYNPVH
jgi:hypothetical protein